MRPNCMRLCLAVLLSFGSQTVSAQSDDDLVTEAWFSASVCVESMAFYFFLEENTPAEQSVEQALSFCGDEIERYSNTMNVALWEKGILRPQQGEKIRLYVEEQLYQLAYKSVTGELE